jgi:hypothetical protein
VDHSQQLCPYLERRDSRCGGVLTLTNLRDAFGRCAGEHEFCSIYHRIRRDDLDHEYLELAVAQTA